MQSLIKLQNFNTLNKYINGAGVEIIALVTDGVDPLHNLSRGVGESGTTSGEAPTM